MQVFKLYFKILRKNIGQLLLYVGIYSAVLFGAIIPAAQRNQNEAFTASKCKYAVFDYDNSVVSKAVTGYLEKNHTMVEIENDNKDTIQDELYSIYVNCVVVIKEGYGDSFSEGNMQDNMEIFAIPGTSASELFKQSLTDYVNTLYTYMQAGYETTEAVQLSDKVQDIPVDVSMSDGLQENGKSALRSMFEYLGWVFVIMCVCSISPVLCALDTKNIRDRISCSSYKFSRINLEINAGVIITGVFMCVFFMLLTFIGMPHEIFALKGLYYILNMFCYMAVALSITVLVSRFASTPQVISLIGNVISLGMAFICGVFVPMEFLSDAVIKIAHFMPAYWYVKAIDSISKGNRGFNDGILYMGVELLFAVVIIMAAAVVYKKKRSDFF